jgi:hypothetical protein
MVTRAPTYTSSSGGWTVVATDQAVFRKKGGSLSKKLEEVFTGYDRAIESVIGNSMQCSAATFHGGGMYANLFNWHNPLAPTPIIVDHLIIRIGTGSGVSGSKFILGAATISGAGQNACALANRALANTYEGASRKNIVVGLPLTLATFYDSRMRGATSFQRTSTLLQGAYKYLTARAINASPDACAGTVYIFWHKAYAGAA